MQITSISQNHNQKTSFKANVIVKCEQANGMLLKAAKYAQDSLQLKKTPDIGVALPDETGYLILDLKTKTGRKLSDLQHTWIFGGTEHAEGNRNRLYEYTNKVIKDKRCKVKTIDYTPQAVQTQEILPMSEGGCFKS